MKRIGAVIITLIFTLCGNAQNLDTYLETAAQNNPKLKAKYVEFEAALQRVEQVKFLDDPTFSFGYFISPVETRVGAQRMKFSLSQMFPWFGTLEARQDIASQLAESKYQEFLAEKFRVQRDVKNAYYPLLELKRHISIYNDNLKLLKTYKELVVIQYSNGKSTMVEVLRANIKIEDAQNKIDLLQEKWSPLEAKFNVLLNRRADTTILLDTFYSNKASTVFLEDSIYLANPTMASYESKIRATEGRIELARKASMPKIGIGLDYVMVTERGIKTIADDGKDIVMPMATISLPLYRSKYKAAIKEAALNQQALKLYKKEYENNLSNEYYLANYNLTQNIRYMELYKSDISKTRSILDLLLVSYTTSGKDFVEILRTQQNLLDYQLKLETQTKEYYSAIAQLEFLTNKI
jgi:outer membrane protein TolC